MCSKDPSSFCRIDQEKTEHIHFNWRVDFCQKVIDGWASYKFSITSKNDGKIVLDVSKLNIASVTCDIQSESKELDFTETDLREGIGSKLTITLPPEAKSEETIAIKICYSTSPDASGLQWLQPQQTSGKVHPYMFSQFQAIHARSVFPCQDSPSIKCTYSAKVMCPNELKVLMSAICVDCESKEGMFTFNQKIPVPSYLICIAVGAVVSKDLAPKLRVWSEKEQIEACAYEFAETPQILAAAEEICGPYVWGRYDLLVLPPSFPYGGMENPCLTFVTPTLLAGDRSLVSVVAHEIAHSWTGNLVTNCSFEHFWLNEGFTVFVEYKIQGKLHSEDVRDFHSLCGLTTLKEEVQLLGETNQLTALVVNLQNLSPDDAFSSIPYMKGSLFLRYLEQLLGGPCVFGCFLKSYLAHFEFKSIETNDFKQYLLDYFKDNPKINEIDWNTWLYSPGMPPAIPKYDRSLLNVCKELVDFWLNTSAPVCNPPDHLKKISSQQLIQFLSLLIEKCPLAIERLKRLDTIYKLNISKNSEVCFRWLRLCMLSKWEDKINDALEFVTSVGRMKYVRPLYRDMYAWETSRERAIANFKKHRDSMMYVTAYTVSKDLNLD